jgi:predicted MFS family arabinose efflux permease
MTRAVVVSALGVTQILAWGSTYYLPAVLAEPVAADTGWPLSWVVGGLSLGLLVAAFVSPRVGRAIEREGGRRVLALSAVTIGVGQVGLAVSPSLPAFVACWLIIGVGMGAGLYDAAFATLGRLYGRDARRAITSLTLFGGFASTFCWPLSAFLATTIGWRWTCAAYAAIELGLALPIYLLSLPRDAPARAVEEPLHEAMRGAPRVRLRPGLLLLLATTMTLSAMLLATLSVHLLPILQGRGASLAAAVSLGAVVGPCQVGARAIEMALARRHHPIWTKLVSAAAIAVGIATLWAKAAPVAVALVFYGAGVGLESIARGTLPLALFGPLGYATLMGRLATPSLIAQAAAPWAGALVLGRYGGDATLAALAGVAFLNVALTIGLFSNWRAGLTTASPV